MTRARGTSGHSRAARRTEKTRWRRKPVTPLVAADGFVRDRRGRILLIRRKNPPFAGSWALPGGFVEVGEAPEDACVREVNEETGLTVKVVRLGGVWGRPGRDPRFHTLSCVYVCRRLSGTAKGGDDAAEAWWFSARDLGRLQLAFDHREIVRTLLRWRRRPSSG